MTKKSKPARKHKSAVLSSLLSEITPLEKAKVEQKMTLAVRIDDLIKGKGYSRKAFAETLGKNPSEVTKWLSGTHNFTIDTLAEIAYTLEVTITELYEQKQVEIIYKLHARVTGDAEERPIYMKECCDVPGSFQSTQKEPVQKYLAVSGRR